MIGRLVALAVCIVAGVGLYFLVQEYRQGPERQPVVYEPGSYQGAPDSPLDETQQEALRERARNQNML